MATFSFHKKDSTGRYHLRIYDKHKQPKRKERSLGTTRKDVARRKTTELEEAYHAGRWDPWTDTGKPEHLSVSAAIDRFLDDKRGTVRPRTIDTYDGILGRWKRGHCPAGLLLKDVDESHLRPFLFASVENATQGKRFRHLRAFFNHMVKAGRLQSSPLTDDLKPRKEEKQPAFLTPAEFDRLLAAIDAFEDLYGDQPHVEYGWLRAALQIAICCGLRRGELVRLRWTDVDLDAGRLHVRNATKGRSERIVPIPTPVLDVLRRRYGERVEGQGRVITYRDGTPVKPDCYTKGFKRFARRAKLRDRERLHFHSLRHSTGAWLASKGVSQRMIQQILGHASPQTTEIYSHLMPSAVEREMKRVFG